MEGRQQATDSVITFPSSLSCYIDKIPFSLLFPNFIEPLRSLVSLEFSGQAF